MLKKLFIIGVLSANVSFAQQEADSITYRLFKVMENRRENGLKKENQINSFKQMLKMQNVSLEQAFYLNEKLYDEYRKYKVDSSISYLHKNEKIAQQLQNDSLTYRVRIQLAKMYAVKGLYIESKELLDQINNTKLPQGLLYEYYSACHSFNSHYGQSTNNLTYFKKSDHYRDSLLMVLPDRNIEYQLEEAVRNHYNSKDDLAEKKLLELLQKTTDQNPERAWIAYMLGEIYKSEKNVKLQKKFYSISAITDIQNTIKDNASLQSLALTYYEMGDIDKAYLFIQAAIEDAVFCGIRYRTDEGTSFYTIINEAYQEKEYNRKKELKLYLILISFLSLSLLITLIYVFKQVKRLIQVRKELSNSNIKLNELNIKLSKVNHRLHESNHIKEEYIAHFFNLCSAYIDKMEHYRKSFYKKANANQFQELTRMLRSNTFLEKELELLYENFDTIFLNIYPSFVEEFNALLLPEEQILPKKGELLNTELRIFALIRLGITDSNKIAEFLRYSLRTVYNYRTKVRNKAAVARDEFEDYVKKIGFYNKQ
ncbi:DUF6377 domain-containing protein [Capnocytophaga canimorsus]|uniref:DUF6377 domain-containing protein n=1 Tax=Capnocytophaga canimorsus TaxID=28188 RepID=UPI0037CFA58F